jgi:hypothetical protein
VKPKTEKFEKKKKRKNHQKKRNLIIMGKNNDIEIEKKLFFFIAVCHVEQFITGFFPIFYQHIIIRCFITHHRLSKKKTIHV